MEQIDEELEHDFRTKCEDSVDSLKHALNHRSKQNETFESNNNWRDLKSN